MKTMRKDYDVATQKELQRSIPSLLFPTKHFSVTDSTTKPLGRYWCSAKALPLSLPMNFCLGTGGNYFSLICPLLNLLILIYKKINEVEKNKLYIQK